MIDRPLGTATVIRGDARSLPLADDSVDLIVTSPPYFALRSYQDAGEHYDGQIGSEPTPAEFLDALLEVTRECVRVLKPSGSIWVNLGDSQGSGHPTQKPLGMVSTWVRLFTNPGDVILDPFAGTGTTLRAAKDEGRRAVGYEVDERWCELAAKRLTQDTLFGGVA